ncbi:hypothetical protein [Lewinella sp. W8]|uniref:hypothetical protein n=1 Tax=Lewinella sp. W8 TaxID=2528208 RepID=UPI0010688EC6|nr:hypothetical protein [Lewinella sp. W8]MTB50085.1 hypothetical protein [Lewinella sp. W8]
MKVSKHFFYGLTVLALLFTSTTLRAQSIQYGGKSFTKFEVLEGSVGTDGKHISVYLAEYALPTEAGDIVKGDNLEGVPDGYYLQLEVNFPDGVKFPILPEDEVLIETSDQQANLAEEALLRGQMAEYDEEKGAREAGAMRMNAEEIAAKTKEISRKMQSGELSPDEAVRQIEALTQPLLEQVEASEAANLSIEEYVAPATFAIKLMDTKNLTSSTIFSGRLSVTRFDENAFEASLNGEHVVECMERLTASSAANEARCRGVESDYVPGLKVMSEGTISVRIKVPLKEFNDWR